MKRFLPMVEMTHATFLWCEANAVAEPLHLLPHSGKTVIPSEARKLFCAQELTSFRLKGENLRHSERGNSLVHRNSRHSD